MLHCFVTINVPKYRTYKLTRHGLFQVTALEQYLPSLQNAPSILFLLDLLIWVHSISSFAFVIRCFQFLAWLWSFHRLSRGIMRVHNSKASEALSGTRFCGNTSDALEQADKDDVALAHRYRLSLPSKPRQSSFRVLVLLLYEILPDSKASDASPVFPSTLPMLAPWVSQTTKDGRTFIVGTNDEGGYMGGAICAERAAFVQLRFLRNFRITKVVISTDSVDPITPGLLCREFLAGHPTVPWDVPVITTGCTCGKCGKKDENLFSLEASNGEGFTGSCVEGPGGHSLPTLQTTIRHLYPYPSPYTRLTAREAIALGEAYSTRASKDLETLEEADSKRLLELAIMEARTNVSELHPIQFGAAVIFDDGVIVTSHQSCALEYGCTLDAVSLLAPHLQEGGTPLLLVQADQFGIAHAPFAPARAFLTENGFGHCQIVLHDVPCTDNDEDVFEIDKWTLKEAFVADLAPDAPAWREGTEQEP